MGGLPHHQRERAAVAGRRLRSYQSGTTYRVQIAQSPTITDANAIDDVTVDQTSYTAFTDLYPEGDLWWRVQRSTLLATGFLLGDTQGREGDPATNLDPGTAALNERPYVDDDTDPATCLATYGDPTICHAYPRWNQHVSSGEFAFRWAAENLDSTYALEVYKDDDTSGSAGKRVISATGIKQAGYVGLAALAPSVNPYRWRIRRTDAFGNQGAWSDYGRFFVDPSPITLIGPTNGALQPPNGPLLSWQPYASGNGQAHHYSVEIRNASNAVVTSISSTSATAWAPTLIFATSPTRGSSRRSMPAAIRSGPARTVSVATPTRGRSPSTPRSTRSPSRSSTPPTGPGSARR